MTEPLLKKAKTQHLTCYYNGPNIMPGFSVNADLADDREHGLRSIPSNLDYYYSYTWSIPKFLDGVDHVISLKDAVLPSFTVNKETARGAHFDYQFASGIAYSDVKITWYDTEGLLNHVIKWRRSIITYDSIGLRQASNYKKNTIVKCFLSDYSYNNQKLGIREHQQYSLVNSWPSAIQYGDLTYTTSDVKQISVTVTYDWFEEEVISPRFAISGSR